MSSCAEMDLQNNDEAHSEIDEDQIYEDRKFNHGNQVHLVNAHRKINDPKEDIPQLTITTATTSIRFNIPDKWDNVVTNHGKLSMYPLFYTGTPRILHL